MKNDLELEISISHQEGWSCALWSALWSPHAGAVWNSQDVLSCLTLPLQVLSTPAKPTSTGCRHSNSVSAWIWHLFHLWLYLSSAVSCSETRDESTTPRPVAFYPTVAQLWETMASAVLAMTLCTHTWTSEPAVIPGYAALGVFSLRRKEISLCSSAAGAVVKKDEYSSASLPASWLKLQPVSPLP